MSTPFPKKKEKRPRSPSEPNKSFVKNVTSRVSGLLPATIAKWFSQPCSSNTNGSTPAADSTDSSTEDEATENPISGQPPVKRIRYNSSSESIQKVPVETRSTSTNTEQADENYTAQSSSGRSNPRGRNIFASTRMHMHSLNDDTSEETIQDIYKPQHSISSTEQSVSKKRKSIFGMDIDGDMYKRKVDSNHGNVKEPYFKPSLICSPFYGGRTMYGGASSSYLSPANIKKKTISVTNETSNNDSVNMSHSARRVMDLLESYSSPLIEAKRILQTTRTPENRRIDRTLQNSVTPHSQKDYSYKTQELYVPNIASILTIKRQSRLMDTTNAARQIIASHSSSAEFSPYPKTNSGSDKSDGVSGDKFNAKIKSRLTLTNRERKTETESNTPETVNLPNVVLQIDKDNLPKFTFGSVSTSLAPQSSSIQTPVIITPEALKKNSEPDKSDTFKPQNFEKDKPLEVKNNTNYFKYSAPIPISSESNYSPSNPPKFIFGSPDRQVSMNENVEKVNTNNDQLATNTSDKINIDNKLPLQKSGWKCLDCSVMNKADVQKCVCCGGKKPVECDVAKKCSICKMSIGLSQGDKCTNCEKMNLDNSFMPQEANDKKWKCKDCLVYNNKDEECVTCGEKNPKKINSAVLNKPDKTVESEWKCNDCWIKNKSSLSKCAACGGSKPGTQTNNNKNTGNNSLVKDSQGESKVEKTVDSTFSSIAKSQSEKWKCPLCLVRNESNRDTCICCEASKPGTEKVTQKFNFHQPSEITFKLGIQPKSKEQCAESEECNMGEESETNNNILPKPTFKFGLPINKPESQSLSTDKLAEVPKVNFTFGIRNAEPTPTVKNNIFGLPNKPAETSKSAEEKPQEVPQVFTTPQPDEDPKNNVGLFDTSVKSRGAPEMPALVPLNQNSGFKKDASFLNPSVTTSSETKTQQNNFAFPSIRLSSNLFTAVPTTTSAVSNTLPGPSSIPSMSAPASTTVSIFQKPNIVTTTTSAFFQKSDATPTLGVSMFPNPETTTTTATTATITTSSTVAMGGTVQPIFSFGSQATAPQAEKPKFSFNFSSNKSDSAIFKPTFGTTAVSSTPNNKFNLPSNSIVGGNALSGSPLNNNTTQMNPLTTGNSLSTTPGSSIFGATSPQEIVWSSGTNNLFGTNSATNGESKSQPFAFGSSAPFGANNTPFSSSALQPQGNNAPFGSTTQTQSNNPPFGSTTQTQPNNAPFGSTTQPQPNNTPFGSSTQTQPNNVPFGSTTQQAQTNNNTPFGSPALQAQPNNTPFGSTPQQAQPNSVTFGTTSQQAQPNNNTPFGSSTQPTQPTPAFGSTPAVFGIASQTTTAQQTAGMFGNHLQTQTAPNMFGGLQVSNNIMPMGIFGAPNPVAPTFGALNPSIPSFEPSTMPPPQPAPTSFNFGGTPSTGIFGFGQQQQQPGVPTQPENPQGMYAFGGTQVAAPNMQFTIGSAPSTNVRRVRKAMRRTQR